MCFSRGFRLSGGLGPGPASQEGSGPGPYGPILGLYGPIWSQVMRELSQQKYFLIFSYILRMLFEAPTTAGGSK